MAFVPGSILSHDTRVTFRKLKEFVSGRTQESIESDIAYISTMKRVRSLSAVASLLERSLEGELKNKSPWNDLENCWEVVQLVTEQIARTDKRSHPEGHDTRCVVEDENVQELEQVEDLQSTQETYDEAWKIVSSDADHVFSNNSIADGEEENEFSSTLDMKASTADSTQSYSEHSQYISPRRKQSKSSSFTPGFSNESRIVPNEVTGRVSFNETSKTPNSFPKSKSFSKNFTAFEDSIIYRRESFLFRVAAAVSSLRKARWIMFNSESRAFNTASDCSLNQEMSQKPFREDSLSDRSSSVSYDRNVHKHSFYAVQKSNWIPPPPSYDEVCKSMDRKKTASTHSFDIHSETLDILPQSIRTGPDHSRMTVNFRNPFAFRTSDGSSIYSDTENVLLLLRQLREAFEILNVLHKRRERLRLHWEDREYRWKKLSGRMQQNPSKSELEKGKRWEEKAKRAKQELEYVTRKIYSIVEQIEALHAPIFSASLCEILRIYMTISDVMNDAMKSLRPFLRGEEHFTFKKSQTCSSGIDEKSSVVNRTQELVLSRDSSTVDLVDESKTEASLYRSVSPIVSPRGLEFETSTRNEGQSSFAGKDKEIKLNNVPEEVLSQIFKYLSIQERALVAQVCKAFYSACNRGELWRNVVLQSRFPSDTEPGSKLSTGTLLESFFRLHGKHVRHVEYFQACSRFAGNVPLQLIAQYCINLEELILNDAPPGSVTDELLIDIFCRAGSCLRNLELNYCSLVTDASLKSLAAFCPKLERFILRSDCSFGMTKDRSTSVTSSGIQAIVAHCEQLKEIRVPLALCERILSLLTQRTPYLTTVHVEDPPTFRKKRSHRDSLANSSKDSTSDPDSDYLAPCNETWHKLLEKFPNIHFTLNIEVDLSEPVTVNSPHLERRRLQSTWTCEDFVETFGNKTTAITDLFIYFVCVRNRVDFRGLGKLLSSMANGFPRLRELRVENLESFPFNGCSESSLNMINEGLVGIITNCKLLSQVSLVNFPFASHVLFYLLKLRGFQLTHLSLGLRDVYEHTGTLALKCTAEESKIPSILLAIGQYAPFIKQLCIADSEHLSRVILKNIMAKLKSLEKLIISNCRRVKQEDIDEISKRYFWVTVSYVS